MAAAIMIHAGMPTMTSRRRAKDISQTLGYLNHRKMCDSCHVSKRPYSVEKVGPAKLEPNFWQQ
ncbi:hypothetical protein GRI58_08075 [Porphyrobacter algicida]|uniref:Uncharacterized protein n=1 Tax=Qipengyuania algicida TaxID=1836209 RepID=A0A845AJP6_9SPHN|nr:hypothetical protein [Qipengyuania algicida]MXP28776.1 hypothetical protein [Qipengyuania algicida]